MVRRAKAHRDLPVCEGTTFLYALLSEKEMNNGVGFWRLALYRRLSKRNNPNAGTPYSIGGP